MRIHGLEHIVYVDTDSVIMPSNLGSTNPAQFTDPYGTTWHRKGVYDRLTIHGPRNIEVGSERRISGLPLTATQTAPLEFSGEVMRSVKRSMRNGELDMVVSLPRQFHIVSQDLRRHHNLDGTTLPFRLEV